MGLDVSHDCWHGAYSSFNRFREEICRAAGLGSLSDYKGFGGVKDWAHDNDQPLNILLNHSDCDGEIAANQCKPLADALEELLPKLDDKGPFNSQFLAKIFIKGLRIADKLKETVQFG